MVTNKAVWGALSGALLAVLWITFDAGAVLLVVGFAVIGALIGLILERPDALIAILQRLQDR